MLYLAGHVCCRRKSPTCTSPSVTLLITSSFLIDGSVTPCSQLWTVRVVTLTRRPSNQHGHQRAEAASSAQEAFRLHPSPGCLLDGDQVLDTGSSPRLPVRDVLLCDGAGTMLTQEVGELELSESLRDSPFFEGHLASLTATG